MYITVFILCVVSLFIGFLLGRHTIVITSKNGEAIDDTDSADWWKKGNSED